MIVNIIDLFFGIVKFILLINGIICSFMLNIIYNRVVFRVFRNFFYRLRRGCYIWERGFSM